MNMREEFEKEMVDECVGSGQQLPDLSLSPCVLDDGAAIYRNSLTQACWWSYRKGWDRSRASLSIQLPESYMDGLCESFEAEPIRAAIEAAGLKVKS
jgi:hypothetical protein